MRKVLEFADYVSIGTGMALACSCFMVIGGVLLFVEGLWLVLAIATGGLLTLLIALSIAEWASLLPGGAGIGAYFKSAFGERTSLFFMFLYLSLVGCLAGVESYVFTQLLERLFPGSFPALPSALAVLIAIILLNLGGFEFSRGFQMFTSAALAVGMVVLAALALRLSFSIGSVSVFTASQLPSDMLMRFGSAVGTSLFLFVGFEWVAPLGRSPKAYARLIPASMVASVLILMLLYGLFAFALVAGPGSAAARGSAVPQFVLSAWALGDQARYVAAGLSLLAMITSFNAGLLGAGRMVYALARQKRLPSLFARVSERSGHPVYAVGLAGVLACVSAVLIIRTGTPLMASSVAACIICLVYGALLFGLLKFRRSHPLNRGGFRSPVPAVVQLVLAISLPVLGVSALFADPQTGIQASGLFIALGIAAWLFAWRATSASVAASAISSISASAPSPLPTPQPVFNRSEGNPS
jgi:amino acid transporter